jgi:hypothetical protein
MHTQQAELTVFQNKKITVSIKRVKNKSVTSILYVCWPELIGKHPVWSGQ